LIGPRRNLVEMPMTISRTRCPLRSRLVAACLAPLALLSGSCDGPTEGRVPVHPARGQVLYKGKPLADALVVLRPVDPATKEGGLPQPTGRTDPEGKFQLHTYLGDDGAPAGSYLVGISLSPAFSETRDLMKKVTATPKPATDVLGTRYIDPANSGLRAEIKPGENEIPPFQLN
jgi:hypothetical protein